jgi:hypothetical protein
MITEKRLSCGFGNRREEGAIVKLEQNILHSKGLLSGEKTP